MRSAVPSLSWTNPAAAAHAAAFTLLELLVVGSLIAALAGLLLPALNRAKEKALVVKVHAELYGGGLALEMYADDHEGRLPPVRVNCNSDLSAHWCQFPVELAEEGYVPRSSDAGREAALEDPFQPGHTYKYAAPGPQLLNGSTGSDCQLWVPDDMPACFDSNGTYYAKPADSPVRWVIWSLGPRPRSAESQDSRAPMAARSWYRRTGDGGVILRFATREGLQFKSP